MTIASIHQPQYLPYLGFFHKLSCSDIFVVLDDVQYQKNGLQNRNKIKCSQGWQWMTIPVVYNFGDSIREVGISCNADWRRKHWNSLLSNYARAPYFAVYEDRLKKIFEMDWIWLSELNMALIHWAMEVLNINTQIIYSSDLGLDGCKSTERLINICKAVKAEKYLSGQGGKEYMDTAIFEENNIDVIWQQFVSPEYPQVFPEVGFISNLSIVDTIFCCGHSVTKLMGKI